MAEVGEGIKEGRQFAEAVATPVSEGEAAPAKAPPPPPPPPPLPIRGGALWGQGGGPSGGP